MRNRKSLLVISIFALVLVLSVGYAVISYVDVYVTGSAAADAEDLDVSFLSVTPTSGDVKGSITDGLHATITANKLTLNNPVTVTYTVQNNETDVDASIEEQTLTNSNSEYFNVTTSVNTAKTCAKNSTLDITVTVTLIKTPVLEQDNSTNIDITFRATPIFLISSFE